MELNEELLAKAKEAKTVEELITLAKENSIELTEEKAKTYFAKLNSKDGILADDELDSVAGGRKCGTIYKDGKPVVTSSNSCEYYEYYPKYNIASTGDCGTCKYCEDGFLLICHCPQRYEN